MENKLWYTKEATYFEEALPLGNGTMGAMVYGKTNVEKISLNVDSLWSGHPYEPETDDKYARYCEMKKAFAQDKRKEAEAILDDGFGADSVQAYLPAGTLSITVGDTEVSNYRRQLLLDQAVAQCSYDAGDVHVEREGFVSAPDDVVVYTIRTSKPRDLTLVLDAQLKHTLSCADGMVVLSGQAYDRSGEVDAYAREDTIRYTIAMAPVTDGTVSFTQDGIAVKNATELVAYLSMKTSYVNWNSLPNAAHEAPAKEAVRKAVAKGVEAVKSAHIADFASFYDRVKLDLQTQPSSLCTDERLKQEVRDDGLVELIFNFGRYLVISSSRSGSLATNLQGIWNELLSPPWLSDYHSNINLQMNYWPVLMCNLPECMDPLTELVKIVAESGKETAKKYYNCEGFVAHHNHDIWGKTTPSPSKPGCAMWMYWNMSGGWLCAHLYEYYEYTKDEAYLKNTALPIMKEAAKYYMGMLEKVGDKMVISPASSPENRYFYGEDRIALGKYATMSQAIIMDLFDNIEKACAILGEEPPVLYPRHMLDTYAVGSQGQLLEYDEDYPEVEITHRHTSHLYGLYPGNTITTEDTVLADACRKTMEFRGDYSTGWAMGWRVNIWSKLKDGDRALRLVKNQLRFVPASAEINYSQAGGTYANLFDAHPPFQIDGNFGVTAGIGQMFLQCENGKIKLLPALPKTFAHGSVDGLLAKGNVVVNMAWKDGKLTRAELISKTSQTVTVQIQNQKELSAELEAGKAYEICP